MRKSILGIIVLGVLLITASLAIAQEKKYEVVIGGGIGTPISPNDFTDAFNLGPDGRVGFGYFLTPQLTIGANVGLNRFGLDREYFLQQAELPTNSTIEIDGGNILVTEVAGVAKYYMMPQTRAGNFYLIGGPGMAVARISDFKATSGDTSVEIEGETDTNFMLTGGAGLTYRFSGAFKLFVEGRYSHIFTGGGDDFSYTPVRVGVTF